MRQWREGKFRWLGQIRGYARPKYTEGVTGRPSKSIEELPGK